MAVAEDHRAEAEQVVDILMTVGVVKARARAIGNEKRVGLPAELHRPGAASSPTGYHRARPAEKLVRARLALRVLLVEAHFFAHSFIDSPARSRPP